MSSSIPNSMPTRRSTAALGLAVGAIWLMVVVTGVWAPDMVTGSQQDHFAVAGATNWFWGLVATSILLRHTVLQTPTLHGEAREFAWVVTSAIVALIWLAAGATSVLAPPVVTGTDPTQIPVVAIVAAPVAVSLTWFVAGLVVRAMSIHGVAADQVEHDASNCAPSPG